MILTPTPDHIKKAVDCVQNGGLIAYPTETVYGLGVDPFNTQALARIFTAKGRSAQKALITLLRHQSDLATLTAEIPPFAEQIINAFWPGPLTLIFKAHPKLPNELLGGRDTIALRHSSTPIAQTLVEQLGGPLTSTSANISEHPPAQSAQEVQTQLGKHLDLILDGGPSPQSLPSTLLDMSKDKPQILRMGVITQEQLAPFIQK